MASGTLNKRNDKKKKRNNLKLLLLASYANNLGWGIYSPLYAIYVLKLGGSAFDISLIWSVYALTAGLLMILFGKLENLKRYNPAFMLVVGYGLFLGVSCGLLMVKTAPQYYLVQSVLALAMGILTPAAHAAYANSEKRGKEAGQWGLYDGGNYILMAVAAFSGGLLFKFGGFPALFWTMLVIQVGATYLALRNYLYVRGNYR